MKRIQLLASGAGFAVLMLMAAPSLAGSGQYNNPGAQCAPGRPNCVVQCKPGRPGCRPAPGYYMYHPHPESYAENHGGYFNAYPVRPWRGYSCDSAEEALEDRGYRNVSAKDCSGGRYGFTANKNGRRYYITFNARTGRIRREAI